MYADNTCVVLEGKFQNDLNAVFKAELASPLMFEI